MTMISTAAPMSLSLHATVAVLCLTWVAANGHGAHDVARFDGNQVVRIMPSTTAASEALAKLSVKYPLLDFWKRPNGPGAAADVRVAPDDEASDAVFALIESRPHDLNYTVMIDDVQKLVDAQMNPAAGRRRQANDPWTWIYHTYDEIIDHFKNDIVPKHKDIASIVTIGKSYEGRDLMAIRITKPGGHLTQNGTAIANDLPGYYMESLIHAREWITGASLCWIVESILENYGRDTEITNLVDSFDMYILLVANPDGYVFTHDGNRMWRKTRKPNPGSACIGTDPNRNWDIHWGEAGTSTSPCDDDYGGSGAATEPEVVAIQSFVKNHGNIKIFCDFHAYSQLWLTPYGWTSRLPPTTDYNEQQACAKAATDALASVHGTRYTYGPISTTIYPASGSSVDYAYAVCDVLYSFGPEGRDTGRYGFLLPSFEIVPSGQENLQAVLAMAKYYSGHRN